MGPAFLLAQSDGIGTELVTQAGAVAGATALVGVLVVLPLFLGHRSEIKRLAAWRETNPQMGEGEGGRPVADGPRPEPAKISPAAARVSGDRPALQRITAERAALVSPSFWRRLLAGGPRHPLVLSLVATIIAIVAVLAVSQILNGGGTDEGRASELDRSEVEVVVLNGTATPALAGKVGDGLGAAGFQVVGTNTAGAADRTVVFFGEGSRREAKAVARELGLREIEPFTPSIQGAAPNAEVVVVAGEDRVKAGRQAGRGG